jgi:hypothetical protein
MAEQGGHAAGFDIQTILADIAEFSVTYSDFQLVQ